MRAASCGSDGEGLHLFLVGLENVYIFEGLEFVGPVDCIYFLTTHLAEIALSIDRHDTLCREILDGVKRKIVGKKCSEMKDTGLGIAQIVDRKRIGLGKNPLSALVQILAIFVLKEHRFSRRNHIDIYTFGTNILDSTHFGLSDRCEKPEAGMIKTFESMGDIESGAAGHIGFDFWSDDLIERDMANAAYIGFLHFQSFLLRAM